MITARSITNAAAAAATRQLADDVRAGISHAELTRRALDIRSSLVTGEHRPGTRRGRLISEQRERIASRVHAQLDELLASSEAAPKLTADELAAAIGALRHVESVRRWTKHGRDRLYVGIASKNRRRGTPGILSGLFVDLEAMTVCVGRGRVVESAFDLGRADWSGAATREACSETVDAIIEMVRDNA